MTTSGTYTFNPANADIVLESYSRIGKRPGEVNNELLIEAANSANYMFAEWATRGVLLWAVDLQSVTLAPAVETITLATDTVDILFAYIETGSPAIGLQITSIDRDGYAAITNKTSAGRPTQFWYNRLTTPTMTFWPVPDTSPVYTLKYYRLRRLQDVGLTMDQTADVNYRYLNAMTAGLAAALALKYAPDRADQMEARAEIAFQRAFVDDQESATMTLAPDVSGYFRV